MSGQFGQRALRSDPDELLSLLAHVGDADRDGALAADAVAKVIADYESHHAGPDVEVIVAGGQSLVGALQSSMSGMADVEDGVRAARVELLGLEGESDQVWREMQALGPIGDAPEVEAALLNRFTDIQAREDAVFDRLGGVFDSASTGHDVTLDTAAAQEIIGRDASSLSDPSLLFQIAWDVGLARDYGDDGDFDTPSPLGDPPIVVLDLPDPQPTGDWDGWWLWRDFTPDDFDSVSMAAVDAAPGFGFDPNNPNAVMPFNARQGALGDCYFVAAVSSVANTSAGRQHLREMIETNGDGTYTVTFGDGVEVTVDSDIYLADNGTPAYGGSAGDEFNWFSVLEKSFAARSDSSYDEIEGGWAAPSWEMLLGEGDATRLREPEADELGDAIADDLGSGRPAALAFDLNDVDDDFDDSSLHEFSVLDIDETAGVITIRNPWGQNESFATELETDFDATLGDNGTITVPIDNLAPIVHTYESYEVDQP